jgi:hypothetical protein
VGRLYARLAERYSTKLDDNNLQLQAAVRVSQGRAVAAALRVVRGSMLAAIESS